MTRNARRTQLTPGYVLHHKPYRDTSRILEVFSRDFGRLTLFARGVRGPKPRFGSELQPFRFLLLSWSGRGEAPQLTGAEGAGAAEPLPAANLMAGFYLNELILKLTTRHDPHPAAFDLYHATLEALKHGASLEASLRVFEKRLLELLGYGLALSLDTHTGAGIDADSYYHFNPGRGLMPAARGAAGALLGRSVLALSAEQLDDERTLEDAKRLLQAALAHCLEGRELTTRAVARSIARRGSRS